MTETRPRLTYWEIALYCIALFVIWTLREFFLMQPTVERFGKTGGALVGTAMKLCIWTLPAYALVRHFRGDMAVPRLFEKPIHWPNLLLWVVALVIYDVLLMRLAFGGLRIRPGFDPVSLIDTVFFVGITEEMVFRGFLLNVFMARMRKGAALCLSAALFVLIHFPIWMVKGIFTMPLDAVGNCLSIFVLGIIFGLAFIRDKNLFSPILLHMVWNLGALLFFG